jgi:hypothetical protein
MLSALWLSAVALCLAGCASAGSPSDDVGVLARWMTGTFDSTAQAASRPEDFRPIRLVMLPIWQDRDDGPWLYVEQAVVGAEERPYRQRVYRLSIDGLEGLRSDVYELPEDPAGFTAAWLDPGVFKTCEPADLLPREGCAIHLRRRSDGAFVGETRGTGCTSRLAGAVYATSEVVITADLLSSWDRGFSGDNVQVWGAEKGPYEFRKLSSGAPRR